MKKYIYPAAALVMLVSLFVLRGQFRSEPLPSAQQETGVADTASQSSDAQDRMLNEIREALQDRIQIAPTGEVPQLPFALGRGSQLPGPEVFRSSPFSARPCMLNLDRCSEVFDTVPEPCLIAAERCEGTPEVIFLGSARR